MTELVEGLTKSEAGEVEEVRVDAGDVVQTANEAEVVGDLVQVFEVLQNLQRSRTLSTLAQTPPVSNAFKALQACIYRSVNTGPYHLQPRFHNYKQIQ